MSIIYGEGNGKPKAAKINEVLLTYRCLYIEGQGKEEGKKRLY